MHFERELPNLMTVNFSPYTVAEVLQHPMKNCIDIKASLAGWARWAMVHPIICDR